MTGAMMLMFVAVMPAMAWGMVYDPTFPKWVNWITGVIFTGPFGASVAAFIYYAIMGQV